MALKKKIRQNSEIDVSSFSDIAFLLIIFFILTTSVIRMTGQELNIPAGQQSQEKTEEDKILTVNLTPGQIRYGEGDPPPIISFEKLRSQLFEQDFKNKTEDKDRMIILNSAPDVPYDEYFRIVCAISDAGGILALVEEDSGEGEAE